MTLIMILAALNVVGVLLAVGLLVMKKGPVPSIQGSPAPAESAAPVAEEAPPPSPPPPYIDGGDDEDVTAMTLAVVGNRPFLKRVSGPAGPRDTFFLAPTGVTTIGRARDNAIELTEVAASSHHCRIEKQGNTYVLTDLGSTNKTWVNGVEKDRVVLRNGDTVKVGETTMIFALFGDRT
jgi:pSer/pThr/pTyr-binding forkhead associated (FHA) protein